MVDNNSGGTKQLAYGIHAISSIIENNPQRIQEIIIQSGARADKLQTIIDKAKRIGISISFKPRQQLDKLVDSRHQGIVAFCQPATAWNEQQLEELLDNRVKGFPTLLLLDSVTDPHNLGACIRVADGAGADAVVIPKHKSASLSATVAKVASGALDSTPVVAVTNLANHIRWLKQRGIWVVGTSDKAQQDLYAYDFNKPIALVMGAEGSGLRALTEKLCDDLLSIPMQGQVNSLNVSVATGISLFEIYRQRSPG